MQALKARGCKPTVLALSLATAFAMSPVRGQTLPAGGVAIHGTATLDASQANKLVVTTTNGAGTNHSAINWQSFSIGAGNTAQIIQPSAVSTSINRVVTNTPSAIFGNLNSNGHVVLVNQSGITIGAGAYVDTAGFTASVVGMSDANAKAGRLKFDSNVFNAGGDSIAVGALNVQGNIIARGGDVVLIAPSVELAKTAVVEAQGGAVMLAAGQSVEITGRGLEGITMQVQAPTDSALNLGTLKGDAVGIFAGTLKHSGLIQTNLTTGEGGRVLLKAKDLAEVDGQIDAQGLAGQGGTVHVTADKVWLKSGALIDVSGTNRGGEALIGGGWHGEDARISNARRTQVSSGAEIKADAIEKGNGGIVVIWADSATGYLGNISAQGGALGGDGGHVEVSGKQYLDFRGNVDTTALHGKTGLLLLDPNNIVIGAVADLNGDSILGDDVTGSYIAAGNSQITAAQVATILGSATLSLIASGNIDINTAIIKSTGIASTLILDAGGNITIAAPVSASSGSLNMTFTAGNNFTSTAGALSAQGGAINITATSGSLTLGSISSTSGTGGNITLTAGSGITVGGAITSTGTVSGPVKMVAGSGGINNSGSVVTAASLEINSGGAVTFAATQQVATLAGTSVGNFGFESGYFSGLTIGTAGSTSGIQVTGGDIAVRQYSNGDIFVNQAVSALSAGNDVLLGIASGTGGITTGATGVVSGRNVQLYTAGAGSNNVTLNANINATGTVTISSAGGINQLGGGIVANQLDAPAAGIGSQNLTGANSISIVRLTRNPTFNNTISSYVLSGTGASSSLVVTGTGSVTIDQALTYGLGISISSDAGITLSADINSSGQPVSLTTVNGLINQTAGKITAINVSATAGTNDIFLNSTTNAISNVTLSGRHLGFEDTGFVNVGGLTATGNIFFRSTGTIILPGAITAPGQLSLVSTGGNLATAGALSGTDVWLQGATGLSLGHNVTATGTLLLSAVTSGGITQTAGNISATAGQTTVAAGGNSITLNSVGNDFISLGATGGAISVTDVNGIALAGISSNSFNLTTSGAITQSAGTVSAASGISLTGTSIGAGGAFVQVDPGAGAVTLNTNTGGIYVKQTAGSMTLANYNVSASATGQAIKLVSAGTGSNLTVGFAGFAPNTSDDIVGLYETASGGNVNFSSPVTNQTFASLEFGAEGAGGSVNISSPLSFTATGGIVVSSFSGNINVPSSLTSFAKNSAGSYTAGGAVTLLAGGNVAGGGNLTVQGGNITVRANQSGGSFAPTGAGSIALGNVISKGGDGINSSDAVAATGKNGGNVDLAFGTVGTGNITVGTIDSRGGSGATHSSASEVGEAGGSGGNVSVISDNPSLTLTGISVNSSGGNGGNAGIANRTGGNGGNAGSVDLYSPGGLLFVSGSVTAAGGNGGNAVVSASAVSGGVAGAAAAIELTAAGNLTFNGPMALINAPGSPGLDNTGAGGASAPLVEIALQGDTIAQSAGASVNAGSLIVKVTANTDALLTETGNSFGEMNGAANGTIDIRGLTGVGDAGLFAGGSLALTANSPTPLTIQGPLYAVGDINLAGTSVSVLIDPVTSTGGNVNMTSGAGVISISGGSTISGLNINFTGNTTLSGSTLIPGGVGAIGVVNVTGDLTMTGASNIGFDVMSSGIPAVVFSGSALQTLGTASFDTVAVSNAFNVVGSSATLMINDLSGNAVSGSLPLITAASISGTPGIAGPKGWILNVSATGVNLVTSPVTSVTPQVVVPTGTLLPLANLVDTFLNKFEEALDAQQKSEDEKKKQKEAIVVEVPRKST